MTQQPDARKKLEAEFKRHRGRYHIRLIYNDGRPPTIDNPDCDRCRWFKEKLGREA